MNVELDIHELGWLLDTCLRGSHLRTGTIKKFVDVWYNRLTEQQRYNLYEWSLRITYNGAFHPSETCCGMDRIFMKRYDPENQYLVKTLYRGVTEEHRAFGMNGEFYIESNRCIEKKYITKVEHIVPKVERSIYEEQATVRN